LRILGEAWPAEYPVSCTVGLELDLGLRMLLLEETEEKIF
jgi:hypothetical protein